MAHINLKNLSIKYINNTVLKDINIEIPDRQITAIIGPSGCGKTTLLKSINRLLDMYDKNTDLLVMRKKSVFSHRRHTHFPCLFIKIYPLARRFTG